MAERDYCRWCADEAFDPRSCTCPHDCGITGCGRGDYWQGEEDDA